MNLKTMIGCARAFRQAAQRCSKDLPGDSYDSRRLVVPEVVCYAFSIEILIKFLLFAAGKSVEKIHQICKLYSMLDQAIQDQIKSRVDTDAAVRAGMDVEIFKNNLDSIDTAFEKWRYFYEGKELGVINIRFIKKLYSALEEIAQEAGYPYPANK